MKRRPKKPTVEDFIDDAKATQAERGGGGAKLPAKGFTRASFDLADDLYEDLKILAVRERRPMREIVDQALRAYIEA